MIASLQLFCACKFNRSRNSHCQHTGNRRQYNPGYVVSRRVQLLPHQCTAFLMSLPAVPAKHIPATIDKRGRGVIRTSAVRGLAFSVLLAGQQVNKLELHWLNLRS